MRYFLFMNGLRGGYMPDNVGVVVATSIKDLAGMIKDEYKMLFDESTKDDDGDEIDFELWARNVWHDTYTTMPRTEGEDYYGLGVSRISAYEARRDHPETFGD